MREGPPPQQPRRPQDAAEGGRCWRTSAAGPLRGRGSGVWGHRAVRRTTAADSVRRGQRLQPCSPDPLPTGWSRLIGRKRCAVPTCIRPRPIHRLESCVSPDGHKAGGVDDAVGRVDASHPCARLLGSTGGLGQQCESCRLPPAEESSMLKSTVCAASSTHGLQGFGKAQPNRQAARPEQAGSVPRRTFGMDGRAFVALPEGGAMPPGYSPVQHLKPEKVLGLVRREFAGGRRRRQRVHLTPLSRWRQRGWRLQLIVEVPGTKGRGAGMGRGRCGNSLQWRQQRRRQQFSPLQHR